MPKYIVMKFRALLVLGLMGFWAKCWSGWTGWVDSIHSLSIHWIPLRLLWLIEHLRCHQLTLFTSQYSWPDTQIYLTTWPPVLTWLLFISLTDQRLWNIVVVTTFTSCSSSSMSQNTIESVDSFLIQIFPCQQLRKKRQLFFLSTTAPLVIKSSAPSLDLASSLIGKISEVTNCLFSSSLFPHYCLICLVFFKE